MVVGILFVLLILIGALLFFQQAQDGAESTSDLRRWRAQRDRFLERLAVDLQGRGLRALADTAGGTVLVDLDGLVQPEGASLPSLKAPAVAELAAALAPAVGCVSVPRGSGPGCVDTDLLFLDGLSVQVRLGGTPTGAALPRAPVARFLAARLSAALYGAAPPLLTASDRAGSGAVSFDDGTVGADLGVSPGGLALVFRFARPPD